MCHMSHFTCHMLQFFFSFSDKVVKLINGGSVINGATSYSFLLKSYYFFYSHTHYFYFKKVSCIKMDMLIPLVHKSFLLTLSVRKSSPEQISAVRRRLAGCASSCRPCHSGSRAGLARNRLGWTEIGYDGQKQAIMGRNRLTVDINREQCTEIDNDGQKQAMTGKKDGQKYVFMGRNR